MVANKRTYNEGFHGLLAPMIPRAPRSLRRRISRDEATEDGEMCAFELLADAADKLLREQESESSTSSIPEDSVKNELLEVKVKPTNLDLLLKEPTQSGNDSGSDHASFVTNADFKKKLNSNLIMEAIEEQNVELTSVQTRVPNKSSSSVHLSFCKDPIHRGNVNINIRDDVDEKYFRYNNINRSNTRLRAFGSRSRTGYKRIRKMTSSSGRVKSFFHKRKRIYMRERFQADVVNKRKKNFHQRSRNSSIKKASSESIVKFRIKSFKVPELYIDVPETATVGSLKRSVMEAVTAILHGELHVGVLVQGKKVRDDNRTLQQSGISQNCNLESLGFMLEPNLPEASSFLVEQETKSCSMQQLSRSPSSPDIDAGSNSSPDPSFPVTGMEYLVEKNEVSTTIEAEGTTAELVKDSKALVLAPVLDPEALAVVPVSEKPTKKFEFAQRRIRRPFSVSEVEALVEAVETLGAGRWRDVKVRAFDDADHRTYVDLKDKWKTLVHTASISPQQRRGEPVPQDLLDRVLAAHAYWSQHQHARKHQKTSEAQM